MGFPGSTVVRNLPNAGDTGDTSLIRGWKILWRRIWQPILAFLPGNPTDRGGWRATVHRVTKSWTKLMHAHMLNQLFEQRLSKCFIYNGPDNAIVTLTWHFYKCLFIMLWDKSPIKTFWFLLREIWFIKSTLGIILNS